jgi:NADPH:quinone reductase-like Zn-dependent oxidoreductase
LTLKGKTMQSQAVLFRDVQQVAVAPVEIPAPGPGEVLIKTVFSTISPGTELRCLAGKQPNAAPWPVIPGYSLSGHIVACGEGVELPLGGAGLRHGHAARRRQPDVGADTSPTQ